MLGPEALDARVKLGLSQADLAVDSGVIPSVVDAWESGRMKVPRSVATILRWQVARADREAALATSGVPECAWIKTFEAAPVPTKLDARNARLDVLLEHVNTCAACLAREAYVADNFPPMPPAPRQGWMMVAVPVAERIQRLPVWAQPAATGAALFTAYSLFKLLFLLPAIFRTPEKGLVAAAEGIALSASIGAFLGLLYGQYRRLRNQWSARRAA